MMMRSFLSLTLLLASTVAVAAREAKVTILATTDLHGNIYPVDYFTGRPVNRGLAKIASLVREVRDGNW